MELKEALNKRKSIRSYTGETIDEKQLEAILTAAYEAPVGMGKYDSIHLTLITNKDLLNQIDVNAANFFGNPKLHPLYGAPLLIVVSSDGEGNVASANVGIIIQNMALAATDEGVGSCDIYGAVAALNENAELLKKLQLPDGFVPFGAIVLGKTNESYSDREVPDSHRFAANTID